MIGDIGRFLNALPSPDLAVGVRTLSHVARWSLAETIPLNFDAYHPQGLCLFAGRFYLSTVDIGRSDGCLLCFDSSGALLDRIALKQGSCFHPGGFSVLHGAAMVPVAEYKPRSTSVMCRVDLTTHEASPVFHHRDHLGAAVELESTDIVAVTWASSELVRFDATGRRLVNTPNPSHYIDIQDMQLASDKTAICTGTNSVTLAGGVVRRGGIALLDLEDLCFVKELSFSGYSAGGRISTCNATWFATDGATLTMWAVPDDGRSSLLAWTTPLHV